MCGKQTIIRIPRTDITSIELTKRAGAERPFAHIVCGLLLLSVGGIGIELLYTMIAVDGEFVPFRVMGLLLLIPVGLWLIISALSKKKMLLVTMTNDRRKIIFSGSPDTSHTRNFVRKARTCYGYLIEDSLTD